LKDEALSPALPRQLGAAHRLRSQARPSTPRSLASNETIKIGACMAATTQRQTEQGFVESGASALFEENAGDVEQALRSLFRILQHEQWSLRRVTVLLRILFAIAPAMAILNFMCYYLNDHALDLIESGVWAFAWAFQLWRLHATTRRRAG